MRSLAAINIALPVRGDMSIALACDLEDTQSIHDHDVVVWGMLTKSSINTAKTDRILGANMTQASDGTCNYLALKMFGVVTLIRGIDMAIAIAILST